MTTLLRVFPVLAAAATALAQAPHLVGLTAGATLTHRDHANCVMLAQCPPLGFPAAAASGALGGTGWDPVQRAAWISNGPVLAAVSDTCGFVCAPGPAPTPGAITGLEVVESQNEIWATDALGNICRMSRTCPPTLLSSCNTGLPVTGSQGLTGLAVDEGRQLVFFSHTDFATGISGIFVAPMSAPCSPFFAIHPPNVCTVLIGVTGLAVDWGNSTLYLTDGFTTAAWAYTAGPGPSITFGAFNCCFLTNGGGGRFVGLAWQPQPAAPFGAPCANGTCPACPMVHTSNGDPNLGNLNFALDLTGAPGGSLVWCLISIGACAAPGVTVPPLCGPLYIAGSAAGTLGTLGPNLVPGAGCAGVTSFPLPLPPNPAFAGLPLASQCVAFCPAGVSGTSLSNCLSFVLQGN